MTRAIVSRCRIFEFKPLSKDDLIDIIFAKGSVLQNFVEMIHTKGQELIVDMAIYDRMAEAAMASPMGARKLESIVNKFLIPSNTDFMEHYRPGIMEYDYDGNYSSVFQNKDGSLSYKFIEGPRAKRRKNHSVRGMDKVRSARTEPLYGYKCRPSKRTP